jgi:DNA-binding response OmpR family regulator
MEIQQNIFNLDKFLTNMISLWKNQIIDTPLEIEFFPSGEETLIKTDISILSMNLDFFIRSITDNFQSRGFVYVKILHSEESRIIQFNTIGFKKIKYNIKNEKIFDFLNDLDIRIEDNSFRKGEYRFVLPYSTSDIRNFPLKKNKPINREKTNSQKDPESTLDFHILIVEDEKIFRDVLEITLSRYYTIHTADNGLHGIETLKKNPIDIILSDIEMWDMNGLDMLEEIRKIPEYASIPIIFLTAFNIPKLRLKGFEGGAQDYIIKPVDHRELLSRIRVHLKQRELYREVQKLSLMSRNKGISFESMEKIKLLIEYIDKNFQEHLTRDNLSQIIGLSPDHMSRFFFKLTGKKIGEYINDKRIEYTKNRLLNSDDKIVNIALDAGFESLRTFNRIFLKEQKVNPATFREHTVQAP